MADAKLSGTLGCFICRLGTFQPGFSKTAGFCPCVGQYKFVAQANFNKEKGMYITTIISKTNVLGTCKCNGKTYPTINT